MNKRIWLTWEYQPRNISMSKALGCEYVYLHSGRRLLLRYLVLIWKTFRVLIRKKPKYVFCQNPSIVLSFLCVLLRKPLKYRCVVDEHNAGLYPLDRRNAILNRIADYIVRNADLLIVTNDNLKSYCNELGGEAIVCPDPLPDMSVNKKVSLGGDFRVMLVCSWADDEPFLNVISAASNLLKEGVVIYATGKPKGKLDGITIPSNFVLTGYLSNDEYKATMWAVDAVMVLTLRDNCMNCGAYEAVSVGKPCIVSDTEVLRDYFYKGFEYVDNSPESICTAIQRIRKHGLNRTRDILLLKEEIKERDVVCVHSIEQSLTS